MQKRKSYSTVPSHTPTHTLSVHSPSLLCSAAKLLLPLPCWSGSAALMPLLLPLLPLLLHCCCSAADRRNVSA